MDEPVAIISKVWMSLMRGGSIAWILGDRGLEKLRQ